MDFITLLPLEQCIIPEIFTLISSNDKPTCDHIPCIGSFLAGVATSKKFKNQIGSVHFVCVSQPSFHFTTVLKKLGIHSSIWSPGE